MRSTFSHLTTGWMFTFLLLSMTTNILAIGNLELKNRYLLDGKKVKSGNHKRLEVYNQKQLDSYSRFNTDLNFKLQRASMGLKEAVELIVDDTSKLLINPIETRQNLSDQNESDRSVFKFYVQGIPLCRGAINAGLAKDGTLQMLGDLPVLESYEIPNVKSWITTKRAFQKISNSLRQFDTKANIQSLSASACWDIDDNGKLQHALELIVQVEDLPYRFLIAGQNYDVKENTPHYFSGNNAGTVIVKSRNINGIDTPYNYDDFDDGGQLTNSSFTMDPIGVARAFDAGFNFAFDLVTQPNEYKESAAFVNINEHYKFGQTLGYSFPTGSFLPITVELNSTPSGTVNNAVYTPGTIGTPPKIQIGNGDGAILQNLGTDGDVVKHEFGHHLVFRRLTSPSGQSLVLHEGLADYYVFGANSNPNLGETVCPPASGACWSPGNYLRTANNALTIDDADVSGAGKEHLRGQVISGFLWSLHSARGVPSSHVNTLMHKAIDGFLPTSGFRDFMLEVFRADKDNFASAYKDEICDEGEARNLLSYVSELDCSSSDPLAYIPPAMGIGSGSSGGTTNNGSTRSSGGGGGGGCGVIKNSDNNGVDPFSTLVLVFAPLLLLIIQRKKQVTA